MYRTSTLTDPTRKYSNYITPDMFVLNCTVVWYHGMVHTMQPGVWITEVTESILNLLRLLRLKLRQNWEFIIILIV